MELKKQERGFYTANIRQRLFWIQSPRKSKTEHWMVYEVTSGLGYIADAPTKHNSLKDAKSHLTSIYDSCRHVIYAVTAPSAVDFGRTIVLGVGSTKQDAKNNAYGFFSDPSDRRRGHRVMEVTEDMDIYEQAYEQYEQKMEWEAEASCA